MINFGGGDFADAAKRHNGQLGQQRFRFRRLSQQLADLTATNLVFNALNVSLSYSLNNIGTAAAGASTTGIYLFGRQHDHEHRHAPHYGRYAWAL